MLIGSWILIGSQGSLRVLGPVFPLCRLIRSLFENLIQENSVYKERVLCFESKMEREIKLNSEHMFKLAILEVNEIWRT